MIMVKLLSLVLLGVGTLAWIVWRARRCASYGCGAVDLDSPRASVR